MDIEKFQPKEDTHWYGSVIAGEQKHTIKSGGGALWYLRVVNTTASTVYAFLFDNTADSGTAYVSNAPPIAIAAHSQVELNQRWAMYFAVGLTVASSSTQVTYSAGGANDLQIHALYE